MKYNSILHIEQSKIKNVINLNLTNLKNSSKAQKPMILGNLSWLGLEKEPNSHRFSLEKELNPHRLSIGEEP